MMFVEVGNFIGEFFLFLLIILASLQSMIKDIFLQRSNKTGELSQLNTTRQGNSVCCLRGERWKIKMKIAATWALRDIIGSRVS